jgi:hypothetical protein
VVAPLVLLDPELAVGALLEPRALHQHHELAIGLVELCHLAVLLAGEVGVHLALAPETVVLLAGGALVVVEAGLE